MSLQSKNTSNVKKSTYRTCTFILRYFLYMSEKIQRTGGVHVRIFCKFLVFFSKNMGIGGKHDKFLGNRQTRSQNIFTYMYQKRHKGPYLNYVINYGGVVVKMFDRNDKQGIVQDDIDDDPH